MSDTERIERCFWCGRAKNMEIEEETEETVNNSVITNYIPCDKCKAEFGNGIHVIGVTKKPIVEGMFPISKSEEEPLYPTGSMFVGNDEFIKELISEPKDEQLLKDVLEQRILMLPDDMVVNIVNQAREEQQGKDIDTYIKDEIDGKDVQDTSN
jgi:hypothetical protein